MKSARSLSVQEILELLPALDELDGLRLTLCQGAVPDPAHEWARTGRFATVDRRMVGAAALEEALAAAERARVARVESLFSVVRAVLSAHLGDDEASAARALLEHGERLEAEDEPVRARQLFEAALARSLPLAEKEVQIVALRRLARVSLRLGALENALELYRRSAELARDSGDLRGEVIARTGLGNVHQMQGRWTVVEESYREALRKLDLGDPQGELRLERGQLYNNLGMITTRLNRAAEAEAWYDRALAVWEQVESPADLAVCYHNLAELRDRQGRAEEARGFLQRALPLPVPPAIRAALCVDLALSFLAGGELDEAERWGREAEEYALAARSPYYLGRMYCGLGNIARARGDADGFVFFEKALAIAREKELPFLEGDTLRDYALFRAESGGVEEARSYLERAREIFAQLGTVDELERVQRLLASGALLSPTEPTV